MLKIIIKIIHIQIICIAADHYNKKMWKQRMMKIIKSMLQTPFYYVCINAYTNVDTNSKLADKPIVTLQWQNFK